MLLARKHIECRPDQPGLADAGLADQQHCLALAGCSLLPALEHQRQLLVASDHGHDLAGVVGLEAVAGTGRARRTWNVSERAGEALEPDRPERTQLEHLAQEPPCAVPAITTEPGVAASCSLAARFGVSPTTASSRAAPSPTRSPTTTRPVAVTPTLAASDFPACVDSWLTALAIARPARTARSASSSVRLRPAEIGQHAIAHELGDVTLETGDLARHGVLVGAHNLPHLFRVEPLRQRGRADQVAEQHCELPPLGF